VPFQACQRNSIFYNPSHFPVALNPGARLGPYEVLSALGAGGMGEVYKARDTRLDRIVAIKILPDALAADSQFRDRFDREARTISQLDHANICALYDVGEETGTAYLVMQYLEGETLADRLTKGALPLDQALRVAIQIADALAVAHGAGIVHRDLKPGNIMLTKSGAKLLDFGLAKTSASGLGETHLSTLPTTPPITQQGSILGTFQYMAPEQIEGREADARTDIFAFGAVVHEMVTGKKAFEGKSQASLIAAIMSADPLPILTLQPMYPPALARLVKICLAKAPDARWHSAHDVAVQLRWIVDGQGDTVARAQNSSGARTLMFATTIAGLGLGLAAWMMFRNPAGSDPVRRLSFSIDPPAHAAFVPAPMFLTVSPDGRHFGFIAANENSTRRLWVRDIDSTEVTQLPDTDDADQPFWSADSRSIGFLTATTSKLKRIDVAGGPPRDVCQIPGGQTLQGGTWSENGTILFATIGGGNPIFSVPATGGDPVPVTTLDRDHGEIAHFWPHFLPDGNHFLYLSVNAQRDRSGIYVASLSDRGQTRVLDAVSNVAYSEPGFLLFAREQTLLAQPFDARRLVTTGEPVALVDRMGTPPGNGRFAFAASRNGVLAYRQQTAGLYSGLLTWFDRAGRKLGTIGGANAYRATVLSPDGTKVATQIGWTIGSNIWIADVANGLFTRLVSNPANNESPVWSPDSTKVAFASNRGTNIFDIYETAIDGSTPDRLLYKSARNKRPTQWSADGKWLLFGSGGVSALSLDGRQMVVPIGANDPEVGYGQVSSNGQWVAYTSRESGRFEIYVQKFLTPSRKWQASMNGGTRPHWRADGRELYFLGLDNKIYAVPVTLDATPTFGTPAPLFEVRLTSTLQGATQFDGINVTPDGQRFLVTLSAEGETNNPVTVRVNWTAALKK